MNIRATLLGLLAAALLVGVAGCKKESHEHGDGPDAAAVDFVPGQTTCPVMGEPIDRKFFTEHEGKRVYFCCKDCPEAFNKDPQKYLAKLEAQRQGAPPADPHEGHDHSGHDHGGHDHGAAPAADAPDFVAGQTTCPVMGGPINKAVFTDYQGKRVYFCCAGCDVTFNSDPEKYLAKLTAVGGGEPDPVPVPGGHGH